VAPFTALFALGFVEEATVAGFVPVFPAVITMITRVPIAAVRRPRVAVRMTVARAILLLCVGRLFGFA